LENGVMNFTILRFDTLASTNTEAADQARKGAAEGLCVVADEQTGGRGRQGRTWTSGKGSGVYMSLVLRPKVESKYLALITLAAAVAVYEVLLKGFLIDPDIKWPNDILVGGKKICGILAEAVETPNGLAVVLGIGINLETPPDENATSIRAETSFPTTRDEVLDAVLDDVAKLYDRLQDEPNSIVEMWTERSSYASGMYVRVTLSTGTIEGRTNGLDETGGLRVKLADGSETIVHAGDVERLRAS
jgi:BirA family biotin operon repressor/biotin-[acetyl-CoA-carboxylase] ligase